MDKTGFSNTNELTKKGQKAAESRNSGNLHDKEAEFLPGVFINSPIGIYIVQNGKFRFVNPEFLKITGYRENELLGMDSLRMVFPEDVNIVKENSVNMLKGINFSPYIYRAVDREGEIRWAIETVTSIQYDGKRATLGCFMDNTKLKRAEGALHESEAQKQAILDGITTSLIFLNENKEILWANNAAASSANKSPEEIIGHTCREFCADLKNLCNNCPTEKTFKTRNDH